MYLLPIYFAIGLIASMVLTEERLLLSVCVLAVDALDTAV